MSTNAIIKVEGAAVCVYKHWDGYPDATMPFLTMFHKYFLANRGVDPQYEVAQLLRASVDMEDVFGLDKSRYTGWGVMVDEGECDVPYTYTLMNDGSIKIN